MTESAMSHTTPRLLSPHDLPALLRLKDAASWNQTEADFRRLFALEPQGCFGIDCDCTLAACATAVCYGVDLAWIGMVLTAPEFRGRGFARTLMEHALEYATHRGVRWAKLDATDMGAPLYSKLGFETECAIDRYRRDPPPAASAPPPQIGAPDLALDRRAFGVDRAQLLAALAAEHPAAVSSGAWALSRSGSRAAYFGPCVGISAGAVRPLLQAFLAEHPNEPAFWDLLPENTEAVELAHEFGFKPVRNLLRMAKPLAANAAPIGTDSALIFAIAGFEYG